MPASSMVGTLGKALLRWGVVTARALSLPPLIRPSAEGRLSNIMFTSPAMRPVRPAAAPR